MADDLLDEYADLRARMIELNKEYQQAELEADAVRKARNEVVVKGFYAEPIQFLMKMKKLSAAANERAFRLGAELDGVLRKLAVHPCHPTRERPQVEPPV